MCHTFLFHSHLLWHSPEITLIPLPSRMQDQICFLNSLHGFMATEVQFHDFDFRILKCNLWEKVTVVDSKVNVLIISPVNLS